MDKKDLIVFTGGIKAYAPKRIKEEGEKLGLNVGLMHFANISTKFSNSGYEIYFDGKEIPSANGVFLRGMGEDSIYNPLKYFFIERYAKQGVTVLNWRSFAKWPSLDKTIQYLEFVKAGVPVVESYFFGSGQLALEWSEKNGYPVIAKDNTGSCGEGVFKLDNKQEMEEFLANYGLQSIKTLLFQKFLKGGEDLRVIVFRGQVLGAMKRIAKPGNFLTNFSQGGDVVEYDLQNDPRASEIALDVANQFELDYCGVDLMKDNDGNWIVLEVNRACQFEGFEKATGKNVAKMIVEFLASI